MRPKLKIGLTLFALGFLGILSLLTSTLPYGDLPEQIAQLPPFIIKLLVLLQPSIILLIAVLVGTLLYDKVKFTVPTISSLFGIEKPQTSFVQQVKYGVPLGLFAGALIVLTASLFELFISEEFKAIGNQVQITLFVRFGYGGITEELLMRFGFMTLVVWVTSKLTRRLNDLTYWVGIGLSTLLFAAGHLPVVYASVSAPSALLVTYTLVGNSIGGLIFGWLYWKKGLESAIFAHIFAHVAMVSIGLFMG